MRISLKKISAVRPHYRTPLATETKRGIQMRSTKVTKCAIALVHCRDPAVRFLVKDKIANVIMVSQIVFCLVSFGL